MQGLHFFHQCTCADRNFCTSALAQAEIFAPCSAQGRPVTFFISAQKRLTIFSPVLLLYEVCNVYVCAHARMAIFHQCTYADSNFCTSAHARPAVFCTSAIHTRPVVFSTSAHTRPAVFFTSANERPAILAPVHLQGLQVREMYFLHQCTFYCGTPVHFAL